MRRALLALLLAGWSTAQAHLMVAQHGTLNLVGTGAFLVLSLPVSAFEGVDDDGDGRLSAAELQAHRSAIEATVARRVRLADAQGELPLQGVMLSLSPPEEDPTAPATQLVVLGRYALPADAARVRGLRWTMELFGRGAGERQLVLTATRGQQRQEALLVPAQAQVRLLPTRAPAVAPIAAGAVPLLAAGAWWLGRRRRATAPTSAPA